MKSAGAQQWDGLSDLGLSPWGRTQRKVLEATCCFCI
jgi:hypothetical protein